MARLPGREAATEYAGSAPGYDPGRKVEVAIMSSTLQTAPLKTEPIKYVGYEPGVCNIGPEEIARRRRAGHIGLIVSILVLAALLVVGAPAWTRLILILTAAGSASGYLQAWFHFCAGFGSKGFYNFESVGTVQTVADAADRSRDRRRSLQIGIASLAIGVVVGVIAVLLPIA
jgi:hypothetical protein